MSSREPLWFCYACNSEMRPLMVPDPVCASCRSDFVEKMDNLEDDPRDFAHAADADLGPENPHPIIELFALLNSQSGRGPTTRTRAPFIIPGALPSTLLGGQPPRPPMPPSGSDPILNLADFIRRGPDAHDGLQGTLFQYLVASLAGARPDSSSRPGGNFGDYVFNQEALDQIITQIMENSTGSRPVPATEDVVEKLPREVLEEGSPLLQKDCAVCKEQFILETEDADEQIIITLPCKHPFHSTCILPWLKSSGTCPVCRYALVPQPSHQPPGQEIPHQGSSSASTSSNPSGERRHGRSRSDASGRPAQNRHSSNRHHLPGAWGDVDD